jgi:hypothetical protein
MSAIQGGNRVDIPQRVVRQLSRRLSSLRGKPRDRVPVADILHEARRLEVASNSSAALGMLDASLVDRPHNLRIRIERATLLGRMGHWPTAAEAWAQLTEHHATELRPKQWSHAVMAQRLIPDPTAAEAVLEVALKHFPAHPAMLRLRAELAMIREDWESAADGWAAYHELRQTTVPTAAVPFPKQPPSSDWYEVAWQEVAKVLHRRGIPRQGPFTAGFYLAMARVLLSSGLDADSGDLLAAWLAAHEEVVADDELDDVRTVERVLTGIRLSGNDHFPERLSPEDAALLSTLPPAPAPVDGLGPLRLIRVPADSTLETALRSTRFISLVNLDRHVRRVARADGWPDAATELDPLARLARQWSIRYGERYAVEPHLPACTLADAMYLTIYHEASQLAQMLRLADDIAGSETNAPVVIEVPYLTFRYLRGSSDAFSLIYLYFALLERGVNAFLCYVRHGPVPEETTRLSFRPGWRLARRQTVLASTEQRLFRGPNARVALVPGGIRAFPELAALLPGATVYESGSVVGEYAYDRHHPRTQAITATAALHPVDPELPAFEYPLTRTARLAGRGLATSDDQPLDGVLEESSPVGGNWAHWLHRVTSEFVEHLARQASADVARRRIEEAHVADYLLPEGVIVGDAVRRAGGRVILHPHSSNPVHIDVRGPDTFDEVEAMTRAGARMWREQFPGKVVRHAPAVVVSPTHPRSFSAGQPLSVVLFGGMAVMGRTPWIDLDRHAETYTCLFDGLADLQQRHAIDVYFKPRGTSGETEEWLFHTVGRRAQWRPTYTHARRLDLPNQVFISVSVGTTALLEGLVAGSPGMIVRDFPVRDYTTLAAPDFPVLHHTKALALLEKMTSASEYANLVAQEMDFARHELGFDPQP